MLTLEEMKVPRGQSTTINWSKTENTMGKKKNDKKINLKQTKNYYSEPHKIIRNSIMVPIMIFVNILGLCIFLQLDKHRHIYIIDKTVKYFKVTFQTSNSIKWPLSVLDCTDFYSIRLNFTRLYSAPILTIQDCTDLNWSLYLLFLPVWNSLNSFWQCTWPILVLYFQFEIYSIKGWTKL